MNKRFLINTLFILGLILPASAAPGNLDLFFGNNGIATAPIGKGSFDQVFAAAQQADGKIVIAGDSQSNTLQYSEEPPNFIVSRINTDGTLDTSFGFRGIGSKRLEIGCRATSVVIQPDGKIVIGGYTFKDYGPPTGFKRVMMLFRLNADGSIDTSFGTDGLVIIDLPGSTNAQINSLALQPDGKLVAAGHTYTISASAPPDSIAAVRFNTNGTLDTGFDGDGKAFIDINPLGNRGNAVAIQTDGKIVIGGTVKRTTSAVTDFAVVRLNADGSLDTGFDGDGKVITDFTVNPSNILGLRIHTDGKIIVAGNSVQGSARDIAVARYNSDGSPDTSFDTDGKLTTDIGNETVGGVAVQPDGRIVVCGQTSVSGELFNLLSVRYNTDGSLDNSYNGSGKVLTAVPNLFSKANAVIVRGDGKIVIAGHAQTFEASDFALARYNPDGSPDPTFDGDGLAVIEPGNSSDRIFDTALQADGKVLAFGDVFDGFYQDVSLSRFTASGGLDTSFGSQGAITISTPDTDTFSNDVIVQPDGKILVSVAVLDNAKYITHRFNPDGSPDNSYGVGGVSTVQAGTTRDGPTAMTLQPDGKIIVAGTSDGDVTGASMVRLNTNGTLDPTFGDGGKVITNFPNISNSTRSVSVQADGKIVIAGNHAGGDGYAFFSARYTPNGTLDAGFGTGGVVYTTFGEAYVRLEALAIQRDGRILLAGSTDGDTGIARYNTDGSLDTSFDGDGKLILAPDGNVHYQMKDIVVQRNGKMVLSGSAVYGLNVDPEQDCAVIRLNPNGSLDTSFGNAGKTITTIGDGEDELFPVLLRPDGRIIGGGYSSNGANDDFTLVRYQGDSLPGFDYDGDGKADISVFRPSEGNWYVQNSGNGSVTGLHFGQAGDLTAPGDFDGDGKADISVYRPSEGNWYRLNSSDGSFFGTHFGASEDKPTVGDFDGDGKADIAVFRPSEGNWYRLNSSDGSFFGTHFGATGDKPAVGDFDGDGKADISVFRPSEGNWYRLNSSDGSFFGTHFGTAEDKPTPADYDGDGKTDISVYRPSAGDWFRLNSNGGGFFGMHFGTSNDKPVPADFDGDGKADIAVFRPAEGNWYILNSTTGFLAQQFGAAEDTPTPHSFVY